MASNALLEGAKTVSDASSFPRRPARPAAVTTVSKVWNSEASEIMSINVCSDEGDFVGLSVGTMIGIKVIGGMGGVGKSVGSIGLGICDASDGAIVGRFDSGRKLGVGVGKLEGTPVGIEVEGKGALGGFVRGRAVVGNAVGSASLDGGGDPVGFAVGDCVMLESVSYSEVHSLRISFSSSDSSFESLPWGSGNPSCRSRSRLLDVVAEQYLVRTRERSRESTTVVLRSFMLAIATTRYVVRMQHGRLERCRRQEQGCGVSARYWRKGVRSYSSRTSQKCEGKMSFFKPCGGRAGVFARR